jgi:tricorn protease
MLTLLMMLFVSAQAATTGGLPRFPEIGHDRVVFTAGGDLWWVATSGGTAHRLTSAVGQERFARISPDGDWIAYTAEYEGDSDVWVIPFDGGAAKRLTWHSAGWMDDVVWDWTPDNKVLFSSRVQTANQRYAELYTVSLDGELPQRLPTSDVGPSVMTGDGSLVFNRYFRNFRNWKRYRGGSQQDLWKFDAQTQSSTRLTTFGGTDTFPMSADDGALYFVSDRPEVDGHFGVRNLFRYESDGKAEQLTEHADFDVDWPSLAGDEIVYLHGADLRIYNVRSKEDRALEVDIPDEALQTRAKRISVGSWETAAWGVGPQAKRVAVVAHGDIFTIPAKDGTWRKVLGGSDQRVYDVNWSPDGKKLAYVSDATGEQEIYLVDQAGGEPRQLTKNNKTWISGFKWSLDGSRILYTDKRLRLWDVDVRSGVRIEVDQGEVGAIRRAQYSADGTWIAYIKPDDNGYGAIWLHNVLSRRTERVTDGSYDDFDLAWDPDARWLYFASRRNFDLVTNAFEFRIVHRVTDLLYAIRLQDDGDNPVPFLSDEEVDDDGDPIIIESDDEKKKSKKDKRKKKNQVVLPSPNTKIDIDGLAERIQRLPIEPGRYNHLSATDDKLFYVSSPAVSADGDPSVMVYKRDKQEVKTVASDAYGYQLAAGGDKMLLFASEGAYVTDASADAGRGDRLALNGLATWVDPKVEWKRTLDEVRRYYRDYFYDPSMHGHDWDAIHARYEALLERATDTSDVIWLIGQMIGELNVGHAYVSGGWDGVMRVSTGKLGAVLTSDGQGIVISKIYEGEPGNTRGRQSPLRAPDVHVTEGMYLVSIDGRELGPNDNPHQWLVGTAGHPVTIEVSSTPGSIGAFEYTVYPIAYQGELAYWDWVETNRQKVLEATDGRVGYLHLPNTAMEGYTSFVKGFYAQHRMDGLIIDVRFNGGGFIPDMFIEPMLRPHFNTWVPRDGADWRTPRVAHHGPKATIINGYAGSGGDAFPYYFRQFGLGKLVGTTTWGGLVGINNGLSLLIGGGVTAPSFGFVNRDGEWDVERIGVAPDVEVIAPPEALHKGLDPQLDAAVEEVLEELKEWKDPIPARPPTFPVRK